MNDMYEKWTHLDKWCAERKKSLEELKNAERNIEWQSFRREMLTKMGHSDVWINEMEKEMKREELLKLKPGDQVMHLVGKEEWETIETITHKDHGVKMQPEEYCCINGYYWAYDDIKKTKVK